MTVVKPASTSRLLLTMVGAAALVVLTAFPAAAIPPEHTEVSFTGDVTDQGEACGDPLAWEFTGDVQVTRFFNADGSTERLQAHIKESGTVTNLETGEVVELPRTSFRERRIFNEDGSVTVQTTGLSVRVTGPDRFLMDVGRFVVSLNPNELLQSSGQHPIREINPFSVSDPALLGAFCGLFD